jgi:hypothetical protein
VVTDQQRGDAVECADDGSAVGQVVVAQQPAEPVNISKLAQRRSPEISHSSN